MAIKICHRKVTGFVVSTIYLFVKKFVHPSYLKVILVSTYLHKQHWSGHNSKTKKIEIVFVCLNLKFGIIFNVISMWIIYFIFLLCIIYFHLTKLITLGHCCGKFLLGEKDIKHLVHLHLDSFFLLIDYSSGSSDGFYHKEVDRKKGEASNLWLEEISLPIGSA